MLRPAEPWRSTVRGKVLETAALAGMAATFALPAAAGGTLFALLAALWLAGRPRRRQAWILVPAAAATLGLLVGAAALTARSHISSDAWLDLAAESYGRFFDGLRDNARRGALSLQPLLPTDTSPAEGATTDLALFEHLQGLAESEAFRGQTLVLFDADGVARAWAGPGLLHEPPGYEVPDRGAGWRRGYSGVTLYVVEAIGREPIADVPAAHRLLVGRSFSSHRLPFTAVQPPRPVHWTFTDGGDPVDGTTILRPRPDAPALAVAGRPADPDDDERPRDSPAARADTLQRLGTTVFGLVLLTLAFLRGGLPLLAGGFRHVVSSTVLAGAGILLLADAARLGQNLRLVLAVATAIAAWGLLRPQQEAPHDRRAPLLGAAAPLLAAFAAWVWQQQTFARQGSSTDLASDLGGPAEVLALRLAGCLLLVGLLRLAAGRRTPKVGERPALLAFAFLIAAAALHDLTAAALPLLAFGGAFAARWLSGTAFRQRPLALAAALLLAATTAATAWEIAYRAHFRHRLATSTLPRVAPPTLAEINTLHLEVHNAFDGFDLRQVAPPGTGSDGPEDVDPQDLAFLLWRRSPLAQRDGASALHVQLANRTSSRFAFGLPSDANDPATWPIPAVGAWREAKIIGRAELRFDGRSWGKVDYTFIPRPGFRLEVDELAELEPALVRGPHRRAIDGLPRPVLFGLYLPDGKTIVSPWNESPPLDREALEAGHGTLTLPAGRFWYWAADTPEVVEVLYLPLLSPLGALERVGTHTLASLLVLAGLAFLAALPRTIGGARELVNEMLSSYSIRLMMVYTALLLLPLVALNLVLLQGFQERLRSEQRKNGENALASARQLLRDHLEAMEPGFGIETELNAEFLERISQTVRRQVTLYWGSEILESSQLELFTAGLLPRRIPGNVFSALTLRGHDVGARVREGEVTYLELYRPLQTQGTRGLFLSVPLLAQEEEVERELERFARRALLVTTALFILLMFVGSRLARSLTTPIMALIDGTRRIAEGADNLDVAPRERELARLAEAIDWMAKRIAESRVELERAQRLAAWAEMARIIAHEIKNPLTPIRLSTEHLQMVYRNDPERLGEVFERCTNNILRQVEELRDLATDFSIYSRIPRAELTAGDLVGTMTELVDAYSDATLDGGAHVTLDFETTVDKLVTRFDAKLLRRALRNLLENALRASAMTSSGTPDDGGSRVVLLLDTNDTGDAVLTVSDTGPGVPEANLHRIFEPYFSTHDTGTGLGLAIVQRIVREHGGRLEARNRPGGGLAVTITIPIST